ncbi:CinA family protein [Desulfoplanes formicivorans]|uniref:Damage-inducible protein CinA n=1 Tax=Desulfoplanes formicivorans TaxID=1592317 RepID=A0A194AL35_9BACT|nr:CinA family protein [Desulfoplanes formicivorans]GAU09399.1 damage-inducible protein CinA [Desulfoplanes formicivorans]
MHDQTMQSLVAELGERLEARKWMMATAESCTGGLVGHELTNVAGSSHWYLGGIISYSNDLKMRLLGVDGRILQTHGAVSQPCVLDMVRGVCRVTGADVGVALSGIAGPSGGSPDKPVGTVWIGWSVQGRAWAVCGHFSGTRREIKCQSAWTALAGLVRAIPET